MYIIHIIYIHILLMSYYHTISYIYTTTVSSLYQTSCMQKHTKLVAWRPRTKVAKHARFNDSALNFRQRISRSDISMHRTDLHSASTSVAILSAISMGSAAWQKGQKRNGRNLAPPGSTVTRRHRIFSGVSLTIQWSQWRQHRIETVASTNEYN